MEEENLERFDSIFHQCPVCEMGIKSDVSMPNNCRLCGMGLKSKQEEFCCQECCDRFKRFRRRLKWKNKKCKTK